MGLSLVSTATGTVLYEKVRQAESASAGFTVLKCVGLDDRQD